jgi:hypothetical protein
MRGGTLLGGRAGLRDTFVGETTRHVVNKAHCRVILTAPPGEAGPEERADRFAPPAAADPTLADGDQPPGEAR